MNENVCVADVGAELKSLIVTYSGTGGSLTINPSPSSTTDLGDNKIRYEFPENTSVTLSGPNSGNIRLDYFSGDCLETSCSLSMTGNKAVLAAFKDISSSFTLLDLNTNPVPTCVIPNGQDIVLSGFNEYKNQAICESPKDVTWNEFDCGNFSDQWGCQEGTNYRCWWNDMGGGGGGDPWMCDQFGPDEYMCNMYGWQYGCSFDYWSGWCTGALGGGSCEGGYQAYCYDNERGGEIPQISSGADCDAEGSTGVFAYSTETYGSITSVSDFINRTPPVTLNNKIYYFARPNDKEEGVNNTSNPMVLVEVDSTNQVRIVPNSTTHLKNYIGNNVVAVVNNKIYYADSDYDNSSNTKLKVFDGNSVQDLGTITGGTTGGFYNINNELMIVGYSAISKVGSDNVLTTVATGLGLDFSFNSAKANTKNYLYACLSVSGSGVGRELYKIGINGAVTLVKDIYPGSDEGCYGSSTMRVLDYNNDKVTFEGKTPTGIYLYYSDGTEPGTYQLHSSASTNGALTSIVNLFAPFVTSWNSLLFTGYYTSSSSPRDLFAVNYPWSANSSVLLEEFTVSTREAMVLGEINGQVIYLNSYSSPAAGFALMGRNAGGTVQTLTSLPILSGEVILYRGSLGNNKNISLGVVVEGKLYFTLYGRYLYATDGTVGGTSLVKDYEAEGKRAWYVYAVGNKVMIITSLPSGSNRAEMELYDPSL